jgi:hypothetical protein
MPTGRYRAKPRQVPQSPHSTSLVSDPHFGRQPVEVVDGDNALVGRRQPTDLGHVGGFAGAEDRYRPQAVSVPRSWATA